MSPSKFYLFVLNWNIFWSIYRCLERRDDLEGLIVWAKRKRFLSPLVCYQNRVVDEELRLNRYMLNYPHLMIRARGFKYINDLISAKPKYHTKGLAARYSLSYHKIQTN